MLVVDDEFMALILRFVVNTDDMDSPDDEFLERQIKTMRKYLARFPDAEHSARAIEWIGQHAARYRRDWERNTVASRTTYLRCADCPLAFLDAAEQCEIHEQWTYLLHRYIAGEATTPDYIETTLALLSEYKDQQRLRVTSAMNSAPKHDGKKKEKKGKRKKRKRRKRKRKPEIQLTDFFGGRRHLV